ncbi:MAG: hypothetical protein GC172_09380 [Phycisphaera sp.]|nr:hypothetical protein [Phycisphaera sp.]
MSRQNPIVASLALSALALCALPAAAQQTTTLDIASSRTDGVTFGSVGGRSNVAILDATAPNSFSYFFGTAAGELGMNWSGNAGVGGWAGQEGALLSDITGVSFDWYRADGGLGGGFRVNMYVYAPTAQGDISGSLLFDLSYLLADQTAGEWNSTGNYLAAPTGSAFYSADFGAQAYTGYKTWGEIQTALAGWSVYDIGIVNDAGMNVAVDNFQVSFVPAPAAAALLGAFGMVRRSRRR